MPVLEKNLLNPETAAPDSNLNADRSAWLADVLRQRQHATVRLSVFGESMLPRLWPGDEVEIDNCSLADLQPGEIALATSDGQLFLHRLIAIRPNGFVLWGDSMPGPDPIFPVDALLGRLVSRNRSANKWWRTAGWILCHCDWVRHLALKLHKPREASGRIGSEAGAS
jgi:Peptidase S24-like